VKVPNELRLSLSQALILSRAFTASASRDASDKRHEVKLFHWRKHAVTMNRQGKFVYVGNMYQRLRNGARALSRRNPYFSSGISPAIFSVLLRTVRKPAAISLAPQ
jgi:hypothetical protein